MDVELALKINRLIHNECKDVPHDIGARVEQLITEHQDDLKVYPFEDATEEQKDEIIRGFVEMTTKHALQLFMSLGLKTHFESMIINDATHEEFILSFKKIN